MKTILLKILAFILKTIGIIIGIPGMAISFIGLYLADISDTLTMHADELSNKLNND